jgi:hypothetical protein
MMMENIALCYFAPPFNFAHQPCGNAGFALQQYQNMGKFKLQLCWAQCCDGWLVSQWNIDSLRRSVSKCGKVALNHRQQLMQNFQRWWWMVERRFIADFGEQVSKGRIESLMASGAELPALVVDPNVLGHSFAESERVVLVVVKAKVERQGIGGCHMMQNALCRS